EVARRLPQADAVLSLYAHVLDPAFLRGAFARHRGRPFEQALTFSAFLGLIAGAEPQGHRGSARQSLARAREAGGLPTCPGAVYGKLRRVPLALGAGLLAEAAARPRPPPAGSPLPACLAGFSVIAL